MLFRRKIKCWWNVSVCYGSVYAYWNSCAIGIFSPVTLCLLSKSFAANVLLGFFPSQLNYSVRMSTSSGIFTSNWQSRAHSVVLFVRHDIHTCKYKLFYYEYFDWMSWQYRWWEYFRISEAAQQQQQQQGMNISFTFWWIT